MVQNMEDFLFHVHHEEFIRDNKAKLCEGDL